MKRRIAQITIAAVAVITLSAFAMPQIAAALS